MAESHVLHHEDIHIFPLGEVLLPNPHSLCTEEDWKILLIELHTVISEKCFPKSAL
ncbi:rCG43761, isoform CRA_a [Rattus norvegicus]|uniref:RCG43761, isoform CRA_a n=1 Tax=Rattus norvegicus TaxID=10116 RepID=A6KNH4_RAT|nr:rCG43761, isoform CRA_a [Rattus norvegicus]EDL82587.1 rCG43761, isoform CRA_a [Rattus norvegicus]EDL82588.1 rCG43761, isoform CRA_a [Rattus norvegicus]